MVDSPSTFAAEIRKLEQKHEEDPDGRYFVPLANAYRQLGELEHAEVLLTDGLKRHPEYLSAHIVLGRCYLDRGSLSAAEEEFRRVLAIDPQNVIALRTLAELAAQQGHVADAEHWYAELLAADPLNEEARRALADLPNGGEAEDSPAHGAQTIAADADGLEPASADPAGDGDDGEVVTETIAELYARQGIHHRAAAVYRELLRRRGHTPELARRLLEIEQLAAANGASRGAAPALGSQETPSPVDAVVEEGLPGAVPPTTIAGYLAELLAWTPAAVDPAPESVHAAANGLASSDGEYEYAAPSPPEQMLEEARSSGTGQAEGSSRVGPGADEENPQSFQAWLRSLKR